MNVDEWGGRPVPACKQKQGGYGPLEEEFIWRYKGGCLVVYKYSLFQLKKLNLSNHFVRLLVIRDLTVLSYLAELEI